ncbi:2Fe-2S iron-sulfur cluster binding domain-containing protein [Massilia sp. Mn16-1_5]|uniref:2Fe-2S iron-sulfur cluster-binding protein n=1 Tax=Massilia sp. Mn16-1_5 TaxID=2079199 RepID=UPI00109EAC3F|nr:2Fe-2S iron-sulfur cluster binding domain-containing protein [Massilia sp. Mn16-1_5]THC40813.1 (2Fe-2S)-binding protein [Massilia sp. Mn16-1_5]
MSTDADTFSIMLLPLGATVPAGKNTVLQACEAAGIDLPNSCRNGTCRTCLCRLESGSVRYLVEWPGLSIEEKRENYLLPCVAVPTGDVVLSAPLAKRRV